MACVPYTWDVFELILWVLAMHTTWLFLLLVYTGLKIKACISMHGTETVYGSLNQL